ncbi:superoxide dismutase [Thermoflavimicrobium dichotomicum]|uniref:superoxide dismutase n=1 Tax=Thermoflavimicrobium dichotomicum TaxID=46223 RepID=A0A1I3Q9D8_9BACL|nr:superoxide dismutase [Thermoflavimicrobium dichotomicum]SFJ30518.1 superoxide dismutase, Fe-Mn family [Thermoflavimicrobium dichotomicum]
MYPTWDHPLLKKAILSSIHLCRQWIREQQKEIQDQHILSDLQALNAQFSEIEAAASSPFTHPMTLYHWLEQVILTQKQYRKWLQTLKKANPSPLIAAQPSESPDPAETREMIKKRVPIGQHQLPPLPYPYDALEPYIDEQTMRIHHDEHHLSYVEGLNTAEKMLEQARQTGNFQLVKHWERELAFNGAGHYLHTLFWETMNPQGGGKPTGSLLKQIRQDFGSFERFQKHFSSAAEKVEGGGWAILVWSPRSHRLEILQAEKHQNLSQWDVIPLLPLDVWEHAYYLKYPNQRKKYISAWWNIVYWPAVEQRWNRAKHLIWQPF